MRRRSRRRLPEHRILPSSSRRVVPAIPRGRSLRDFDLHTRIFKYPCSYLIYSEAFDAIPEPAKEYIYGRVIRCSERPRTRP